jgi:hypothetical protein
MANDFDPFRAQAGYAWRNRWARLRRDGAQSAVHAAALLGLALLLGVPAWNARASWGGALADLLQRWPAAAWLVAVAVMASSLGATLQALRTSARRDWLAALPVAPAQRRRRARDAALREAAGFAIAGGAALLAAGSGPAAFAALAGAVAVAIGVVAGIEGMSVRRGSGRQDRTAPRDRGIALDSARREAIDARDSKSRNPTGVRNAWSSVIADRGVGRLWRWQRLACGVALHGRTLAWGALAWLAVPMGEGLGATFGVGVAGISLALLVGAWRRSLAVLPQAQRWLETQPLAAARMLRATCAIPGLVLALSIAAATAVLLALNAPGLAGFAALALFAFGALQFAASVAERRHPARGALVFLVHAALLVGVLQAFPLAAVPLWMVQMTTLLRRAVQ